VKSEVNFDETKRSGAGFGLSMVVRGSKSPSPQPSPGVPGEGAGSALGRDSGAVERSKSNHRGARRGRRCGADSKGGIADAKIRMLAGMKEQEARSQEKGEWEETMDS